MTQEEQGYLRDLQASQEHTHCFLVRSSFSPISKPVRIMNSTIPKLGNFTGNFSFPMPFIVPWTSHATCATGVVAFIENLLILIVFFSSGRLRRSSSLLIGLTISHTLNGIVHVLNYWPSGLSSFRLVPVLYCMNILVPNLFVVLYQFLPILLALIGFERLLAVAAPVFYRKHCTPKRLWLVTGVTSLAALISLAINWINAWLYPGPLVSSVCVSPQVFSKGYLAYAVHLPAILGGLSAMICTGVAIEVGRRQLKKISTSSTSTAEIGRMKKQIRLVKCVVMVSCLDMACVVVPNILLGLYGPGYIPLPVAFSFYMTWIYSLNSVLTMIPYAFFNIEFRKAMIRIFTCGRSKVDPVAMGTTRGPRADG